MKAEPEIVEGLAQFYTEVVGQKLQQRIPVAYAAYEKFLELQSGPYIVHREWTKAEDPQGEIVRASMN